LNDDYNRNAAIIFLNRFLFNGKNHVLEKVRSAGSGKKESLQGENDSAVSVFS